VLPANYLDSIAAAREDSELFHVPWPMPGSLGGFPSFATFAEWRAFVLQFSLHPALPLIASAKFECAQKLYILTWIDFDLIKAGELVALTALELALTDRYAGKELDRRRKIITKKVEDEKRKVSRPDENAANSLLEAARLQSGYRILNRAPTRARLFSCESRKY
jgi:hypothetical protein